MAIAKIEIKNHLGKFTAINLSKCSAVNIGVTMQLLKKYTLSVLSPKIDTLNRLFGITLISINIKARLAANMPNFTSGPKELKFLTV